MALCFEDLSEVSNYLKLIKDETIRWMQLQHVISFTNLTVSCISAKQTEKNCVLSPTSKFSRKCIKKHQGNNYQCTQGSFFPLEPGRDYYQIKISFYQR